MTKNMHVPFIAAVFLLLFLAACFAGCTSQTPVTPVTTPTAAPTAVATTAAPQTTLVIATTTSLYDTKLLDMLQPMFESKYNVKLKITSQGAATSPWF